jgi:hypothetical protein
MIGKASIYVNLCISALIMVLGLYSLFIRGSLYEEDIMAFILIAFVFGICLLFDIYCITLQRNNNNYKVNSKGLLIKGRVLFVFGILATIGSLLVFTSLIYSLSVTKRESSTTIIIIQIFTVFILLLHSISAIISLVQYKKLLKINKNLQADIVNTIGDNIL